MSSADVNIQSIFPRDANDCATMGNTGQTIGTVRATYGSVKINAMDKIKDYPSVSQVSLPQITDNVHTLQFGQIHCEKNNNTVLGAIYIVGFRGCSYIT